MLKPIVFCRWAPSLGALEATHQEVWGTKDYNDESFDANLRKDSPTVFFGLYDLRDYIALRSHKGQAFVLWAGSDIENLIHGFTFNDGKLKWLSLLTAGLFTWYLKNLLNRKNIQHYVEDLDEHAKLVDFGLKISAITPSFLGNMDIYTTERKQYKHSFTPHVYVSCSGNRQEEYGFGIVERIASRLPKHTFHLYGAAWKTEQPNIIVHGRVPKEQFNKEIANYQCGLRLNKTDGFSEITAKSVLMAQYPITYLEYPMIPFFNDEDELVSLLESLRAEMKPNLEAQQYYKQALNNFPFNVKKYG